MDRRHKWKLAEGRKTRLGWREKYTCAVCKKKAIEYFGTIMSKSGLLIKDPRAIKRICDVG